jgi:hypothetical protein
MSFCGALRWRCCSDPTFAAHPDGCANRWLGFLLVIVIVAAAQTFSMIFPEFQSPRDPDRGARLLMWRDAFNFGEHQIFTRRVRAIFLNIRRDHRDGTIACEL